MLGTDLLGQPWFRWAIVILISFPIAMLILNEVINRLRKSGSAAAAPLAMVRGLLVPAITVVAFVRLVIEARPDGVSSRLTVTAAWILGLLVVLSIVNVIVFSGADTDTWRGRAPNLFVDITRVVLLAIGAALVTGVVWDVDLGGVLAAFGITGIVVGLALQDTLASLMGGLALLFDKPFTVGDWVLIGELEGRVTDINWRTVRLSNREEDLIVVPNIVFGTQVVLNNSRPDRRHIERVPLGFSYNDPPNKVKHVLIEVARSTPGVLPDPPPRVLTTAYNDFSIDYEVWLHMETYDVMPEIRSAFMTRVWYAAQRHDLTIPFPIRTVQLHRGPDVEDPSAASRSALHGLDESAVAVVLNQVEQPALVRFAAGESLTHQGAFAEIIYLVVTGTATGSITDEDGNEATVAHIGAGNFAGEAALNSDPRYLLTVTATTDVTAVALEASTVRTMSDRDPAFARDLQELLESRRAAAGRARAGSAL